MNCKNTMGERVGFINNQTKGNGLGKYAIELKKNLIKLDVIDDVVLDYTNEQILLNDRYNYEIKKFLIDYK